MRSHDPLPARSERPVPLGAGRRSASKAGGGLKARQRPPAGRCPAKDGGFSNRPFVAGFRGPGVAANRTGRLFGGPRGRGTGKTMQGAKGPDVEKRCERGSGRYTESGGGLPAALPRLLSIWRPRHECEKTHFALENRAAARFPDFEYVLREGAGHFLLSLKSETTALAAMTTFGAEGGAVTSLGGLFQWRNGGKFSL